MSVLFHTGFAVCIAGTGGVLVAEAIGRRGLVWIAKPAAAIGFVLVAVGAGAVQSSYGHWVLAGLGLCLVGDVLLIPDSRRAFLGGLVAFLLGHVAYVVAFAVRGVEPTWTLVAFAALVVPRWFVLRWLLPKVGDDMKRPVQLYAAVITVMLAAAVGTAVAGFDWRILAGAAAFYVSDLSVARDRFVASGFANKVWGLPLYFGGQLLLAASVS